MKQKGKICSRCIMDESDQEIHFDENGMCNHCRNYDAAVEPYAHINRENELNKIIGKIKRECANKEYDCILGISGGVDSAYLAYIANEYGLRVLAVHVDAGWNSEIAVDNIQKLCSKLGFDLHTIVIDWPTMKELQRAYMFSGLANLDVPQDHAFLAATYAYARKNHIKYMLNGSNYATEGILPISWGYDAMDFICLKDVYKKNGRKKVSLKKYPRMNIWDYIFYQYMGGVERVNLLNYVPYSKKMAIDLLGKEFGWQYYGGKHYESRFTKFFQGYYLPQKFGYDKKRAHLSSLVVGGELSREEALKQMDDDSEYTMEEMLADREYICKKLDISDSEWETIMRNPCKTVEDYKNNMKIMNLLRGIKRILKKGK